MHRAHLSDYRAVGKEERGYCKACNRPVLVRDGSLVALMGSAPFCRCDPEKKDEPWRLKWIKEKWEDAA